MTIHELTNLKNQLSVLKEVAKVYKGHTIDNIIQQIDSRIKNYEKRKK